MIEGFLKWLLPHKDIVKNGELYLRRHFLTPRKWKYKVFLHLIKKPDDDRAPHDHPWSFLTTILWGGYVEAIYNRIDPTPRRHWATMGSVLFRRAEHIHQIETLKSKQTWTLVIAGPQRRVWGFWDKAQFTPYSSYLKLNGDA
jgi:hypothetical protein